MRTGTARPPIYVPAAPGLEATVVSVDNGTGRRPTRRDLCHCDRLVVAWRITPPDDEADPVLLERFRDYYDEVDVVHMVLIPMADGRGRVLQCRWQVHRHDVRES
jgi:hypothetical protein